MNKLLINSLIERLKSEQSGVINAGHSIGNFTYGVQNVFDWKEGARLTVGKFCSIAEGVNFMLGGNHRTDWISTYPFNVQLKEMFGTTEADGESL